MLAIGVDWYIRYNQRVGSSPCTAVSELSCSRHTVSRETSLRRGVRPGPAGFDFKLKLVFNVQRSTFKLFKSSEMMSDPTRISVP